MSKKKLSLITAASILAAIILVVCICAIIANSKNDNSAPTQALSCWMSLIEDDAPLKSIAIAGAHDAGTVGLPYFSATQNRDAKALLEAGTRYLDLRVAYTKDALKIYHGPSKGVDLESVLKDVKAFITSNASETVILDFQHFGEENGEAQSGTVELVESIFNGAMITNETPQSDVDFIDTLTLRQARGKVLVIWGRETSSILEKNYVFKRNNDGGTRENSALHSYYVSELNKKSSSKYINEALPQYIENYKQLGNGVGLFVLQGQLTDGLYIFGPKFREATHTDNMNKYIDNLADSENLNLINIIIRDFVTPNKNCRTLKLNLNKGLVKTERISDFEKMIEENLNK